MVTVNGSIKAWEKCDVDLCLYSIHPSDNFIRFAIKTILGIFSTGLQQNWFEIVTVNDQCMQWSWTVRADWTLHNSFLCCKLPRNSSLHEAYTLHMHGSDGWQTFQRIYLMSKSYSIHYFCSKVCKILWRQHFENIAEHSFKPPISYPINFWPRTKKFSWLILLLTRSRAKIYISKL